MARTSMAATIATSTSSTTGRRRTSRYLSYAAVLFSVATTILFILFTIATCAAASVFSIINIVTVALFFISLISITLYTLLATPTLHKFRIPATLPSLVATITGTAGLAWMSLSREKLPEKLLGTQATPFIVLGFSTLLLTAITQTLFWATILLSPAPISLPRHGRRSTISMRPASLMFPPPAYTSPITQTHRSSRRSTRFSLPTTRPTVSPLSSPPSSPPKSEVNHFDTWTPDSDTISSVAESIKQIALETAWEEDESSVRRLGVQTTGLGVQKSPVDRVISPTLPDSGRARGNTFPSQGWQSAAPEQTTFPGSPLGGPPQGRRALGMSWI